MNLTVGSKNNFTVVDTTFWRRKHSSKGLKLDNICKNNVVKVLESNYACYGMAAFFHFIDKSTNLLNMFFRSIFITHSLVH